MAYDPNEVQSYIREAASRRGIDPHTALRVFKQESSFNPLAKNISDREESYGVTQLNAKGGLGVDALKSGIDIRNPDTWKQQVDFSLDTVAKDGWRQWYGARDVGINRWDGIGGRSAGEAAGAVTQMAGGGRGDADSPLVSAYADRGTTGQKIAGPSTQAAGPVVNVAPEQSTDLEKAMLGRALQTQVRNPWDAIGGLAQVWAANSAMKEKEGQNAASLKQAVAGAGLDPDMAMAAQLGGTRESLADALVAQRQARTQAEQRQQEQNWRQEGREYEQGRDRVADERYSSERDYRTGRDTTADARANRTLDIQERVADQKAEPFKTLSAEEATAKGLPPGAVYQQGPNGQIDPIGNGKGQNITVNTGSDSGQFYKTADENRAKTFVDIANAGNDARRRGVQIDQLEKLLGNVQTGGTASLKQLAGRFGVNTEGLDDIQAASSLIDQMVPSQRAPGSGTMSDADLALFKSSLPQIINQPGGNATIIQTMRGISNYDAQMSDIANKVLNRDLTPAEGQSQMNAIENPLARFREGRADGAGDGQAATPKSDAEYNALPSGSLFVDPDDGKTYRKP